jgi:hypothetical protein
MLVRRIKKHFCFGRTKPGNNIDHFIIKEYFVKQKSTKATSNQFRVAKIRNEIRDYNRNCLYDEEKISIR